MKKIILSLLLILNLSACTQSNQNSDKPTVVVSFYVLEAIVNLLASDQVNVITILPENADAHSYELSSHDMVNLTNENNLIILGHDFEPWYSKSYEDIKPKEANVLIASKGIEPLESSANTIDPHMWLSLDNFKRMTQNIKDYLNLMVEDTTLLEQNYEEVMSRLQVIKDQSESLFENKKRDLFVVSHPAFQYLAKEYNLQMISVNDFGHSEEVDANRLKEVIKIIKDNDIPVIFYDNPLDQDIANTIALETKIETVYLASLESKEEGDIIDQLQANIDALARALQ